MGFVFSRYLSLILYDQGASKKMGKMFRIPVTKRETARSCFERFLMTKRSNGVQMVTITTCSQQFHAISKHLDIDKDMGEMTVQDLQKICLYEQKRLAFLHFRQNCVKVLLLRNPLKAEKNA